MPAPTYIVISPDFGSQQSFSDAAALQAFLASNLGSKKILLTPEAEVSAGQVLILEYDGAEYRAVSGLSVEFTVNNPVIDHTVPSAFIYERNNKFVSAIAAPGQFNTVLTAIKNERREFINLASSLGLQKMIVLNGGTTPLPLTAASLVRNVTLTYA